MTSSASLVELLLERLNALPPGALSRPGRAELHDLEVARAATRSERLRLLDDLLLATEAMAPPRADLRVIESRSMLL